MKKYLIALDLDGTVLRSDATISDLTVNYLKELQQLGHKIVIATGRPIDWCIHYYNQLGLNTPIVTSNGGFTTFPNNPNFENIKYVIKKELVIELTKILKDVTIATFISDNDKVYMSEDLKEFNQLYNTTGRVVEKIIGPFSETLKDDPSGAIFIVKKNAKELIHNTITSFQKDSIMLRQIYENDEIIMVEIYSLLITKSKGLQHILDYYNLTNKDLIAIGDAFNDKDMIEFAYVGVAMNNAEEDILETAKFITKDTNNNDGVVRFLDHFLNIYKLEEISNE